MLLPKPSIQPVREERRRYQRVKVHLLGRYMLPDRREYPCQVINMSPGGVAMLAPGIGNVGDRVVAYLDHIGRVEGKITRIIDNGFAMTVGATPRKRDKLAAQLTWLANRDILNLPEDRRHDRIVPRNPIAVLTLSRKNGLEPTVRPWYNLIDFARQVEKARQQFAFPGAEVAEQCYRPGIQVAGNDGSEETLTASEFDLLKLFAENPNRPLQRDWLLESAAHREMEAFDRAIDLRITRLRRKIEVDPAHPDSIRTVRGVGYMFVPPRD